MPGPQPLRTVRARLRSEFHRRDLERLAVPQPVLEELLRTRRTSTAEGRTVPLRANISAQHATALYDTVRREAPTTVLEVGMAHGVSSLAILTALAELRGERRLISIDPWEHRHYAAAGVAAVARAGLSDLHELVVEPDHLALPRLLGTGRTVDMAYVDGMHTFDRTLLDFFYVDKMLAVGGLVAFNDCAMPAVHRVTRFVTRHRKYAAVDVGLGRRYLSASLTASVEHLLTRRSKSDRYFRKLEEWEPPYDFWQRF